MQPTDLTKITDVDKLKSMAYDQLVNKEVAERNLQSINQRIVQLGQSENKESKKFIQTADK